MFFLEQVPKRKDTRLPLFSINKSKVFQIAHSYILNDVSFQKIQPTSFFSVVLVLTLFSSMFDVYNGSAFKHVYYGDYYISFIISPLIMETPFVTFLELALCLVMSTNIKKTFKNDFVVQASVLVLMYIFRYSLGYIFSRGTGFAYPNLYFNESMHESSTGLIPLLWGLMALQNNNLHFAYCISFKNRVLIINKFLFQLLTLTFLMMVYRNCFWWNVSGILSGIIVLSVSNTSFESSYFIVIATCFASVLLLNRKSTALISSVDAPLSSVHENSYYRILTFLLMTAPRRDNIGHLVHTIASYIEHFPTEGGALHDKIHMVVYTNFKEHDVFTRARDIYSNDSRITFIQRGGMSFNQKLHFSEAISFIPTRFSTNYVGIIEDDFPLCDKKAWNYMLNLIYQINVEGKPHCGIFIGTGGR
jgi:hypothetical protein